MKRLLLSCCLLFAAHFALFAQPANDDCSAAIAITLDEVVNFTTNGATDAGPTVDCFGANDSIPADIWFTFTPAETMILNWSNCSTADFDSRMAVFAADDACMASNDNLVTCNDDGAGCADNTSELSFVATGGQSYIFNLGGYADADTPIATGSGTVVLTEVTGGLANDFCALAESITTGAGQFFSTAGATTDGPNHLDNFGGCFAFNSVTAGQDVWYTYTADFTGTLFWDFCGTSNYDTRIVVYQPGSPCPPAPDDIQACNDDGSESAECAQPNFHSDLFFDVVNGETYLLRVGGFGTESGSGTFDLIAQDRPDPPANDLCENAIAIDVVSLVEAEDGDGFVSGTTIAATIEEETFVAPSCTNDQGTFADVWYTFESNGNPEVRVDIATTEAGTDFVAELFVDCGGNRVDTVGMNNCLATDDDNPQVTQTVTGLPDGVNTTIWVRVLTYTTFSPTGNFAVQVGAANPSAVRELEEVENAILYPNPVRGQATIDFSLRTAQELELQVVDIFGRTVANHQLGRLTAGGQRYSFDTGQMAAGMYTVLISNGQATRQLKMVVR